VLFQTRDHSVMQSMVEAGIGDVASLRRHPGRNVLLYALGSIDDCRPDITTTPITLEAGDVFLMCSDGFWDYVDESVMLRCLRDASSTEAWLAAMEAELLSRVSPGHDNYTAVGVRVGAPSEETRILPGQ
jgi:serine/threonine protein phosphatase PrpC